MKIPSLPNNPSKSMKIFCGILIFGLLFLILLNFLLPKKLKYTETPIDTTISFNQEINFTFSSCSYNPKSQYLEAVFSIDAPISMTQQNYETACYSDRKPSVKLNSNSFLTGLSTMIIQVQKLPKNFSYIEFVIQNSNDDDSTSTVQSKIRFYCSKKSVTIDENLSKKTDTEYRMTSLKMEEKRAQNKIKEEEEKIKNNDQKCDSLQKEIEKLDAEKAYETDDEIKETDSAISAKKNQIADLKKSSDQSQEAIKNYQNKINKLEEKLTELQGNTS